MLISVCMATYNGAKYLREQVDSILQQEFRDNCDVEMELVVSDDESTDDTIRILESYHDPRIKMFYHRDHRKYRYFNGTRACKCNFENAIRQAQGEYIFLSDQDDVWYPHKIDRQLTVLRKFGGVNCASFDMGDGNLKRIGLVIYPHDVPFFTFKTVSVYGFSMGFSREELKYLLPFPNISNGHDNYIQYSAAWRRRLSYIDEPCAIHRWTGLHNVSSFSSAASNQPPFLVKAFFRLYTYVSVIWRGMVR